MEGRVEGTRRKFVGGAVAVVVAGAAGMMRLGRDHRAGEAVRIVDGRVDRIPGFTSNSSEITVWQQAVGTTFGIGAAGFSAMATLSSIERIERRGALPLSVRQQPFVAYFAIDPAAMPAVDGIFTLTHAIDGLASVFMMRGHDRAGAASLVALFN